YIPSAFLLILAGMAAARLPRHVLAGAMLVVLALASLRAFTYAHRWNDPLAFYETGAREQPNSVQLHILLSGEKRQRGDLDGAERALAQARRAAPDYYMVYNQSALVAIERGDLEAAEQFVGRSMSLHPNLHAAAIGQVIAERRAATQPSK